MSIRMELQEVARALILFGALVAALGLLLLLAPKIPGIGRLPGDILIQRPGFTFYFPLASCLLISLLMSLLWGLFRRR